MRSSFPNCPAALSVLFLLLVLVPPTRSEAALRPAFRIRVGESPGPRPPVFDERVGRAYLVDAQGRVRAVDTRRGKEQWLTAVRCGRDAFALVEGRLICVNGRRPRLLVLDAQGGRLLARESVEGGPYVPAVVGSTLVLHETASGRLLGYDIARMTWSFDYHTDADALAGAPYRPLVTGERYYYTEDEWRTLWAIEAAIGRQAVVARSDTPVRLDQGRAARMTHGLLLSYDTQHVLAFDVARARRAWRLDVPELLGVESAERRPICKIRRLDVAQGQLHIVVEVAAPVRDGVGIAVPARWLAVLVVSLRTGVVRRTVPLHDALPLAALPRIELGLRHRCDAIGVTGLTRVDDHLIISLAPLDGDACGPHGARYPYGWVLGIDLSGKSPPWHTAPRTAARLVDTETGVYGLWGRPGIPHGERTIVELDPHTGRELARRVLGYTSSWSVVRGEQLWVGTKSGTVVVYLR